MASTWEYSCLQDFFVQSDPQTPDGSAFDVFAQSHFGLKSRDWRQFKATVQQLNNKALSNEFFKVFFLARHGEGVHNQAEAKYGTEAWDAHWSLLNGDDELVWGPDPELTDTGRQQAAAAHAAWRRELKDNGAPLPQLHILSPFVRALDTAQITWKGLSGSESPFVVKELWRETMGEHTCDKRRSRSFIAGRYPEWHIEAGFAEEDELWKADERETSEAQVARLNKAVSAFFEEDGSKTTYVAVSAHSGAIRSILQAVNFPRAFNLGTGGMIPIVVKGVRNAPSQQKSSSTCTLG